MPHLLHMVLAATEFDDADLVGAAVGLDRGANAGARRATPPALCILRIRQQHFERDRGADTARDSPHAGSFALHDAVLLTAGFDDWHFGIPL
jgi:hypothetical protein